MQVEVVDIIPMMAHTYQAQKCC